MLTVTPTGANIDFHGLRSLFLKSRVQTFPFFKKIKGELGEQRLVSGVVVHFTFGAFSFTVEQI